MKKEIVIQLSLLGAALVLMLLTVMCARTGGPREVSDPAISQLIEGGTTAADEETSKTKSLNRKDSASAKPSDAAEGESTVPKTSQEAEEMPEPRPSARPRPRAANEETSF